jgi:hypothetical protein
MRASKSWKEKLHNSGDLPKVEPLDPAKAARFKGASTMLIPAPLEVDAVMRTVPDGKLITINEIRETLCKKHGAGVACPFATGIFAWIAAHASDEAESNGEPDPTPYWRTLKNGGELNAKYPGGVDHLKARLEAEGHRVVNKGKKWVVENYKAHLVPST